MDWKKEWGYLALIVSGFLALYHLPVGRPGFDNALIESLELVKWYAREHVLLCLVPALFIAGAITVFVRAASVMRYLGPCARRFPAYGVASISGSILAVCSCTVLPLFAGIYKRGAGLGPATAFLYSGPAINVLAIILTARVLGFELGIARAVGAILFSIVIGLTMHLLFRKEEAARTEALAALPESPPGRPLWQTVLFFASMIAILIFATWSRPEGNGGFFSSVYSLKWTATGLSALLLALILVLWHSLRWQKALAAAIPTLVLFPLAFAGGRLLSSPLLFFGAGVIGLSAVLSTEPGESGEWFSASWELAKQIFPLLLLGVAAAGLLLGRPGHEGLVPSSWIAAAVGGNSLAANLFASVAGALMYFATLTEIPILQGLMGSGMGKGPALALLLAGPALSLPSMLVLHSILGWKKTLAYILLVVVMATITGLVFGMFF